MVDQSVGATTFTLAKMLDHAFRRAGFPAQKVTSEMLGIGRECMQLILYHISNSKLPLWCQDKLVLGLYQGEAEVQLPAGTVDVLKAFYRTVPRVGDSYISPDGGIAANADDGDLSTSCTQTAPNGSIQVQTLGPVPVTLVGFMPNGDQFYNLVFEASNDGVTWTLVQTIDPPFGEVATSYPDKKWAWYDVASPASALLFRVRETSGGTLNLRELVVSSYPLDTLMYRMNRDQYLLQPNKTSQGRPLQYWLNRQMDQPIITMWPPPSGAEILNCLLVWRSRYIADVQNVNQAIEIPRRWYEAMTWSLAQSIANEMPGEVDPDTKANIALNVQQANMPAMMEERDRSPIQISYNLRRYTRA